MQPETALDFGLLLSVVNGVDHDDMADQERDNTRHDGRTTPGDPRRRVVHPR